MKDDRTASERSSLEKDAKVKAVEDEADPHGEMNVKALKDGRTEPEKIPHNKDINMKALEDERVDSDAGKLHGIPILVKVLQSPVHPFSSESDLYV